MNYFKYYIIFIISIFTLKGNAQLSVTGYTNYNFNGFDVLVENVAFNIDTPLTNVALDLLEEKLIEISLFEIDQTIIDSFKEVPIFMDWNTTNGAAQYHPSEAWLIDNGYIPEKAMSVEISNINNFIDWTILNQPYMVLHEIAHAYHHRVLNYDSPIITNAYNNAISLNLYTNVSYHQGNENYSTVSSAYALNNEFEFFSELTEAYFGLNDFYPFNYNDLNNYDSVGFDAMVTIWGNINPLNVNSLANIDTIKIFPNPSENSINIDLGNNYLNTKRIEIINTIGEIVSIYELIFNKRIATINTNDLTSGVYFVKVFQKDNFKTIIKVLKK